MSTAHSTPASTLTAQCSWPGVGQSCCQSGQGRGIRACILGGHQDVSVQPQASRLDVRGFPGLSWGPGEKAEWVYVSGKLLDSKLTPEMGQWLFPDCTDS